tara:strand:+ start:841 stop:1815 length:975 start_codon:yes stop_codon:yes gene_type:complete
MFEFILNRFYYLIIALIIGIFYKRFIDKYEKDDDLKRYELIRHFLLNESDIATSSLPILWIHVPYELNSRSWESFNSRSSKELNLSYIQLTISSIIKHCGNDFKICLIDDKSFVRLIPGWSHNLDYVGSPLKDKLRMLAKLKLLKYYGGMFVPQSFLCIKSLIGLYKTSFVNNLPFFSEIQNNTLNGGEFITGMDIMGSDKNNTHIDELIQKNELLISNDYTSASNIIGKNEQTLVDMANNSKINVIDSKFIGTKDIDSNCITVDHLFSRDYIKFDNNLYGINIPHDNLMKRHNYNWFCKLTESEIFSCDTILCKYILMAHSIN